MSTVRSPAVAGTFYPAQADRLKDMVAALLDEARARVEDGERQLPKAMIAPHAGYVYSGPIAASAFAQLTQVRERIRRVVMIGPAHRHAVEGFVTSSFDAFSTPLGEVPLDSESIESLLALPQVSELEAAHQDEHCLEVHLPFLQTTLEEFRIVPLLAGSVSASDAAEVIEHVWGGAETLLLISSDLSHYHDAAAARALDRAAADAIERLEPSELRPEHACGHKPIWGLLEAAKRRGLCARTVDLRNSGDTSGPRDQVVGYGAFVFVGEPSNDSEQNAHIALETKSSAAGDATNGPLTSEAQDTLLDIALASIRMGIGTGRALSVDPSDFDLALREPRATFVTLRIEGALRGCVGTLEAVRPLVFDVAYNAHAAAFSDPRFGPLAPDEVAALDIHISILSPPEPVAFTGEGELIEKIRVGVDGLILEEGSRRGTLLPSMWDSICDPGEFLMHLKAKAGLAADYWSGEIRISRYTTESFGQ